VWTIGHSTRSIAELLAALRAYDVELVADVRRYPGSRRLPQFGEAALRASLEAEGLGYAWIPALGGRRRPAPDSPNSAWRHEAFRGYADHVQSEAFAAGLFELLMLAGGLRTAVMCSEVLWWRCHRRLIADVLTTLGIVVVHIGDATHAAPHLLAPPARVVDGVLRYDDGGSSAAIFAARSR
jgi:uncharacterized protein (DUF488 family)